MKLENTFSSLSLPLVLGAAAVLGGCGSDTESSTGSGDTHAMALTAQCSEAEAPVADEAFTCGETQTVECTSGTGKQDVDTIVVPAAADTTCEDTTLTVSDPGPYSVGEHAIAVTNGDGETVCEATVTVTDTAAPTVTAKPTIKLWPPNHKLHAISVADCATAVDACDGELAGEFIWASSDEPANDKGDGNTDADIVIDSCGQVSLRAERQGPKEGRVYRLGVRFVDGAGQAVESECAVLVDHDQRGVDAADSGEAYKITLDGSDGALVCDGVVEPPADDADGGAGDSDDDDDDDDDSDTGDGGTTSGDPDPSVDGDPDPSVDGGDPVPTM